MGGLRNQLLNPEQNDSTARPVAALAGRAGDLAFERHYTPTELGLLWRKDPKTIRRLFEREPGCHIDERAETRKKRRYRSFSIPESVVRRVHTRLSSR